MDKDFIEIRWFIDDVKMIDDSLTYDQCKKVLEIAKRNHDANIGINFEVLQNIIENVKGL